MEHRRHAPSMLSRLVGDPSNVSTIAIAAVAVLMVVGGVLAATIGAWRLGSAWTLRGTGDGVSLVSSSSGTAGILYDLAVGSGLFVDYLGGNVKIWLDGAVVSAGGGQSLIEESAGVTTLYDLGSNSFTNQRIGDSGAIEVSRVAPRTATYTTLSVISASSPFLEYFTTILQWAKRDTVTSSDSTTWTYVEAFGYSTMKFNTSANVYMNTWVSVPEELVVNSTIFLNMVSSATCYYDGFTFPPEVQLITYEPQWPGGVPAIAWTTESKVDTEITCWFNIRGYSRLT